MISGIPPVHILVYDGCQTNIFHASIGEGLPQHEHTFTHATICMAGSIVIRKEGKELVMTKITQPVNLTANEWHEIEALEDNTVFVNIFAEGKY